MKIDDLNSIIINRRATPPAFFNDKDVDNELIRQLLENANWAPSHKQTEPWRFIVYKGESKNQLGEDIYNKLIAEFEKGNQVNPNKAEKFRKNIQKSSVVIAIIMERDPGQRLPEWEEVAAVSCAVQNMWLTAETLGLKAFWATPGFIGLLNETLNLDQGQKSLGFFYVGNSDVDYPSPGRGPVDLKIKWFD